MDGLPAEIFNNGGEMIWMHWLLKIAWKQGSIPEDCFASVIGED